MTSEERFEGRSDQISLDSVRSGRKKKAGEGSREEVSCFDMLIHGQAEFSFDL